MGYTNETKNLKLPQWVADDHPDFLTDVNEAFKTIDENAGETAGKIGNLPQQVEQLTTLTQSQGEDIAQLQGDVTSLSIRMGNAEQQTRQVPGLKTAVAGVQATQEEMEPNVTNNTEYVAFATKRSTGITATAVSDLDNTKTFNFNIQRYGMIITAFSATNYFPEANTARVPYKFSVEDTSAILQAIGISAEKIVEIASVGSGLISKTVNGKEQVIGYMFLGYDAPSSKIVIDVRFSENVEPNTASVLFAPRAIIMEG